MNKKALITGSGGLIGSEAVKFFCDLGFDCICHYDHFVAFIFYCFN